MIFIIWVASHINQLTTHFPRQDEVESTAGGLFGWWPFGPHPQPQPSSEAKEALGVTMGDARPQLPIVTPTSPSAQIFKGMAKVLKDASQVGGVGQPWLCGHVKSR